MHPTLTSLSAIVLLASCGTTLGDARESFSQGLYPQAKEELLSLAQDYPRWDRSRQARYAMYLGLTHAELGDVTEAKRWLGRAKALEDAHRGTLSDDDWHRLELGLAALEPWATP